MKTSIYLAIDPDCKLNGFAKLDMDSKSLKMISKDLSHLLSEIHTLVDTLPQEDCITIVVEAVWLQGRTSWHIQSSDSKQVSTRKGFDAGMVTQRGKDIYEMIMYIADTHPSQVQLIGRKPLFKTWRGKERKITHEELEKMCENAGISCPSRSSQDQRDAALLALTEANIPLLLKPFI